jgi:16S rRNA G1207 methylase RsmC
LYTTFANSIDALKYGIRSELISFSSDYKTLVVNPEDEFTLSSLETNSILCFQEFKPFFNKISRLYNCLKELEELSDALRREIKKVVIFPKKQKTWLQAIVSYLINNFLDLDIIVVVPNSLGGRSFTKYLDSLNLNYLSYSKNHTRVTYFNTHGLTHLANYEPFTKNLDFGDYKLKTALSGFSPEKIDLGSKLLLNELKEDPYFKQFSNSKSVGADFGAGYGLIIFGLLQLGRINGCVELLEANYAALECAKLNLMRFSSYKERISFKWTDLVNMSENKFLTNRYDWIVMNPPFHEESRKSLSLGRGFIEAAHSSLKRQGVLYLVYNSNLPYTETIFSNFKNVKILFQGQGFRVCRCSKDF